jgi:clan AA aspartic protease (TIGR02281 family)
MNKPTLKELLTNPHHFFAFGFGSGLAPKAPGTVGTLAAIPLYLLIQDLSWGLYLSWILVTFVLGIWWCDQSAKQLGVDDPSGIVWDEFVGFWITLFLAPQGWWWILIGFLLFRFFDILKPWPIRWFDNNVKGGLGIMLDDFIAGVFAFISLQLLVLVLGVTPAYALDMQVKMLAKDTAMIEINGKQRMLKVNEASPEGVTLISADGKQAIVEAEGVRHTLTMNRRISTAFKEAGKTEVRIASGDGGHFFTAGKINGMDVQFLVDTGATGVSLNRFEAERIGIDYKRGIPVTMNTANGTSQSYAVILNRVSVGGIELNQVEAFVSSTNSPEIILLGNSYLGKLNMSVEAGVLLLKKK